jgi:hypothetical protein
VILDNSSRRTITSSSDEQMATHTLLTFQMHNCDYLVAIHFRQDNPAAGITTVTVTNSDANSIRVTVTGSSGVPTVELFDSDAGLIFSFIQLPLKLISHPSQKRPNKLNLKIRQRRLHLVMRHLNKRSLEGKHSQMKLHPGG